MTSCPIGAADRRLRDAFHLWKRVEREYFNPYEFRVALNSFIQEARNVTWILQKAKSKIPGFQGWYEAWQTRMRDDPILRWIVESRNRITKQGDLETESRCTIAFIAGWTEEATLRFNANPFVPADVLIREALREIPREVLIEESLFCIERRWIDNALPDTEILDATSHALTVLCTLVDEAHNLISKVDRDITCDLRPRLVELRNTFPIDLVRADDDRKVWVGAQRLNPIKYTLETRDFAKVDIEKVRERYASDPDFEKRDNLELLEEGVRFFLYAAKQILMKDGRALSFVFALRRDDKQLEVLGLAMEDRVGKHIAMRQAAVVLSRIPVFWALLVGESWVSYLKPGEKPTRHAADDPSRQEALTVNGVSSDGAFRNAHVKFSRRNSGIVFGEERFDSDPTNLMTPVLAAIRQPAN